MSRRNSLRDSCWIIWHSRPRRWSEEDRAGSSGGFEAKFWRTVWREFRGRCHYCGRADCID